MAKIKKSSMLATPMDMESKPHSSMTVNSIHAPGLLKKTVGSKVKMVTYGKIKGVKESYSKPGTYDHEIEVTKVKPMLKKSSFKAHMETI
jgi:hypothetical protein